MTKIKVIIIGQYPPPYGGISVHIKRMKLYLEKEDINVTLYNEMKMGNDKEQNIIPIGSYKKFIFKIPFLKADILHFHSIDKKVRILLGIYKIFNKKLILSVHGQSLFDQLTYSNIFVRKIMMFSIKHIDKIICVNPATVNELINLGVDSKKIESIPAYINPIEDENDFKDISKNVWEFIDNSKFLISANGCVRFYNNEDLYGIDMLIELVKKLKENNYQVNLIIALLGCEQQNRKEKQYYQELNNRIINYKLSNEIFIFETKNTEFYPILKKSKLFLRPTNTDGYGISVAEALYYKVPAIASDVCNRPDGTVIFKSRNLEDLYKNTIDIIERHNWHKERIKGTNLEDNAKMLLEIYKEIIDKN